MQILRFSFFFKKERIVKITVALHSKQVETELICVPRLVVRAEIPLGSKSRRRGSFLTLYGFKIRLDYRGQCLKGPERGVERQGVVGTSPGSLLVLLEVSS